MGRVVRRLAIGDVDVAASPVGAKAAEAHIAGAQLQERLQTAVYLVKRVALDHRDRAFAHGRRHLGQEDTRRCDRIIDLGLHRIG